MNLSRYIVITLGLFVSAIPSYAQDVDSTKIKTEHREDVALAASESLLEKKIKEKIQLEKEISELGNKKKELSSLIKTTEKETAEKTKENGDVEKKIQKLRANEATTKYSELIEKKRNLEESNKTANSEIASLRGEISNLELQLSTVNAEKSSLLDVEKMVSKELVAKYRPYLLKTFSQMDLRELNSIKSECSKYSVDKDVNDFSKKVETTIKQKHTFDASAAVLNNAYNSAKVNKAITDLQSLKLETPGQRQEVSATISLLQKYEKGIKTFKEFINAYSRKRELIPSDQVYSNRDFNEDKKLILSKNDLKSRIESDISLSGIPYLKKKWDEYMASIEKDHKKITSVETEILQQ